ncbi:hypothetical protein Tco_0639322 [Tanacetum coccineum]
MGLCTTNSTENGTSVTKMFVPLMMKKTLNQKNDVKARSLLQKIVSRLAILGVVITQEDLNSNFLRSLPPEWNTHVVVWMNKAEVETISIDDFSTNDVNTAKPAYEVSTVSPNVNTASPQVSTASFSDNVVYAFMVENPNGSNLLQQDLEQIHEDDLEAIDLKWQLFLLSMREKRTFFARECKAPRNKKGQFQNIRQQLGSMEKNDKSLSLRALYGNVGIDGEGESKKLEWTEVQQLRSDFVEGIIYCCQFTFNAAVGYKSEPRRCTHSTQSDLYSDCAARSASKSALIVKDIGRDAPDPRIIYDQSRSLPQVELNMKSISAAWFDIVSQAMLFVLLRVLALRRQSKATPSPDYVPGPEYPEYLASADDEIVAEDQPYANYASPAALSPAMADDDESSDVTEVEEEDYEEEEEH